MPCRLGEIFSQIDPVAELYTKFKKSVDAVATLMGHPRWGSWLRHVHPDLQDSLESYLILPRKSLDKYGSAMSALLRHTPRSHWDWALLSRALRALKKAAGGRETSRIFPYGRIKCAQLLYTNLRLVESKRALDNKFGRVLTRSGVGFAPRFDSDEMAMVAFAVIFHFTDVSLNFFYRRSSD